jgi:hypothetical protein
MRLTQSIAPSRYGNSLLHCGILVAFVARVMSAPGQEQTLAPHKLKSQSPVEMKLQAQRALEAKEHAPGAFPYAWRREPGPDETRLLALI